MDKKIIVLFVILIFSAGIVSAENEDISEYIQSVSIDDNVIKFSDGFTGFSLDSEKNNIEVSDNFTVSSFTGTDIENEMKLAVIECYRQEKEDAIGEILTHIDDKDSGNKVLQEVFKSDEKIGDTAVVNISNNTEATFEFELLKSVNKNKSDCLAYTVSFKTIIKEDTLSASSDENTTDNSKLKQENKTQEKEDNNSAENKSSKNSNTVKKESKTSTKDNNTSKKESVSSTKDNNTAENENTTSDNDTNKTTVNKTTTVTVTQKNTTTVTTKTVTHKNTTNDTPENDTLSTILKNAGNPIVIAVIAVAVAAIVLVAVRRKG